MFFLSVFMNIVVPNLMLFFFFVPGVLLLHLVQPTLEAFFSDMF